MTVDVRHPAVRDLCWVMSSPSLLAPAPSVVSDDYCQSVIAGNEGWLRQLDIHPESLLRWLAQNRFSRLGYYFEHLVEFWLQQRIAPDRIESHLRVFREKRVLGEYDFIFQPSDSDTVYHWETVVKFYLRYQDEDGVCHWYGPNANDTLDKKLSRLMSHQLKLSELPEARALLHSKGYSNIRSRAFFKGYLFYPSGSNWSEPGLVHSATAPGHLKGWWTTINELHIPGTDIGHRYMLLPRMQWLASKIITETQERQAVDRLLLDARQLREALLGHFDRSRRPLLVAALGQGEHGSWREKSRGFVVSRFWPENA